VMEYDDAPPQAKILLAQLLSLPGGDRDEALKVLDDLFNNEGLDKLPANMRAEAFILRAALQEDPDKALADYNKAIELEPNEEQHRLARAEFYRQQKKFDEAVADIEAVLEKQPDQAAGYLIKAQLLREQEKLDEALAALDKASELAPSAPTPFQAKGEIYRQKGDNEKAIQEFNKALEAQPGLLITLVHRAEAYLSNKQYDLALADVDAVLKEHPDMALAHGLKAQVLVGQDKLPEAIEEMKKLADAAPDEPQFRLQLAWYYLYGKETRQAIEAFGEVLSREPENFAALRGRADAYLNIGEHEAAVADFEKALAIDDKDTSVLNNFAWVLATSPDDNVRDGKRAVELATKAVELTEEKEAHILSTLAAAYAETGDFDNAVKLSQKAMEVFEGKRAEREAQDGKEAVEKLQKELAEELDAFNAKKPWRERQTGEEAEKPTADQSKSAEEQPAEKPETTPASAEAEPIGL
jgi:tetratricopeptide (TPR) repeat protein